MVKAIKTATDLSVTIHSKIASFINVFSVRLSRAKLAFEISRVSHYYVLVPDHLAIVIVTFYENEGFSDTSFRDYSRNQNLGVLSSKHAGHIWKVICQLPKIIYREVEKNSSKRI